MEIVSGIKLRDIFLDNGNWWKFFLKHRHLIRLSIITNVIKMLICRTSLLGYHLFACPSCNRTLKVPHSCKSRFCSSCGKKATDDWIKNSLNTLPNTTWQHITFTMPSQFWDFFWVNRKLMNEVPKIAANIIIEQAQKQGFYPGIYLAVHTFGRDLKRNLHLHLSTTVGGLSIPDRDTWVSKGYFYHDTLKKMWRYEIITLLRKEYKAGRLKLPPVLKHIKTHKTFSSWLNQFYHKTWNVHLNKHSNNIKNTVEYLGRYLKRPPIGETRIKAYDGETVTYEYLDHYTDEKVIMRLPVLEFLGRVIAHIPDRYWRSIRYYGFLSNRLRGKLLPLVNKLLKGIARSTKKVYTPWRAMFRQAFGRDPLKCPACGDTMVKKGVVFAIKQAIINAMHQEIANGYFQIV